LVGRAGLEVLQAYGRGREPDETSAGEAAQHAQVKAATAAVEGRRDPGTPMHRESHDTGTGNGSDRPRKDGKGTDRCRTSTQRGGGDGWDPEGGGRGVGGGGGGGVGVEACYFVYLTIFYTSV